MQLLQAGHHKFILLELEPDLVGKIAKQCGFSSSVGDNDRSLVVELTAEERETPLLLFDATDPSNLGWFSRCQFYVDGGTGAVLQTPISVANQKDGAGRILPQSIRVQIAKELPESFRLPGKQPVTEQSVYSVLANFLTALIHSGVAICGGSVVKPLSGRIDGAGTKN